MLFVYTTCADTKEAENLGKLIIDKKMGACVEYWEVNSMYNWEGEFKNEKEIMVLITTAETKLDDLTSLFSEHHSYSVPMIAGIDVRRINRPYKEWMMQEVV